MKKSFIVTGGKKSMCKKKLNEKKKAVILLGADAKFPSVWKSDGGMLECRQG